MLLCHFITYVSYGTVENEVMRAEHTFLPPKALPPFMFLSVSNFLARLSKFLLHLQPKCPFSRLNLGHNVGTVS